MRILIIDDEPLALEDAFDTIRKALPRTEIIPVDNYVRALEVAEQPIDLAFLDMEMPGMNGMELAKILRERQPKLNIVFLTAFPQYALEAYQVQATNYLLKPLSVEAVQKTMANLRYPLEEYPASVGTGSGKPSGHKLRVECFGNFAAFDEHGSPVVIRREKAKELLAYLVAGNGVASTTAEICEALWGEMNDTTQNYFWKITSELRKALRDLGDEEILVQTRGSYAIDPSKIDCDYYQYLAGTYAGTWNGQFMEQYSIWAEMAKAKLELGQEDS